MGRLLRESRRQIHRVILLSITLSTLAGCTDAPSPDATVGEPTSDGSDELPGARLLLSAAPDGKPGTYSTALADLARGASHAAFATNASNIVVQPDARSCGDPRFPNFCSQVAFWDESAREIKTLSVGRDGSPGNGDSIDAAIAATGTAVVFHSYATNLDERSGNATREVMLWSAASNSVTWMTRPHPGAIPDDVYERCSAFCGRASISADGSTIAFDSRRSDLIQDDNNAMQDVFVAATDSGTRERVSVAPDGSELNDHSWNPRGEALDDTGRLVVFASRATNTGVQGLPQNTSQVYLHDRETGSLELVSRGPNGEPGNDASGEPVISGDGRYVAFSSRASNLVQGDNNGHKDVFLYDRIDGRTLILSRSADGVFGDGPSWFPSIDEEGQRVSFSSSAASFSTRDHNDVIDVYLWERGHVRLISADSDGFALPDLSTAASLASDGSAIAFSSYAGIPQVAGRPPVRQAFVECLDAERCAM